MLSHFTRIHRAMGNFPDHTPTERNSKYNCGPCRDKGVLKNGDGCPDCCPHLDLDDHRHCLDCGKAMNDWGDQIDMAMDALDD